MSFGDELLTFEKTLFLLFHTFLLVRNCLPVQIFKAVKVNLYALCT